MMPTGMQYRITFVNQGFFRSLPKQVSSMAMTNRAASGRSVHVNAAAMPAPTNRSFFARSVAASIKQQATGASMPPAVMRTSGGNVANPKTTSIPMTRRLSSRCTSIHALRTSQMMLTPTETWEISIPSIESVPIRNP